MNVCTKDETDTHLLQNRNEIGGENGEWKMKKKIVARVTAFVYIVQSDKYHFFVIFFFAYVFIVSGFTMFSQICLFNACIQLDFTRCSPRRNEKLKIRKNAWRRWEIDERDMENDFFSINLMQNNHVSDIQTLVNSKFKLFQCTQRTWNSF